MILSQLKEEQYFFTSWLQKRQFCIDINR